MTKNLGLFLVFSCVAACGQDDGGQVKPSVSATTFASSACKKDSAARSAMAHRYGLMVINNEAGLDGLRCVAWQRVGAGEFKIDLYNFDSACGATWAGDAAVAADGTLELHIDNPSCRMAQCGKCLYDWSFDVQAAIPANQATPVAITIDSCKGQQQTVQQSAALGAGDAGISCVFADYGSLTWQAEAAGTCGKAGMPCVGSLLCGTGSLTSTGTCDSGLTCDSSAAVNEPRCLASCTTIADCPRADAWSCQSGLCRPAE
jgi:hypothetical protein